MGIRDKLFKRLRGKGKAKAEDSTADGDPSPQSAVSNRQVAAHDTKEKTSGLHLVEPPATTHTSAQEHTAVNLSGDLNKQIPKTFHIDVVAIHGINGNLWTTWQHEDSTFWLRDLLPPALPGARVWTYGYPANVFEGLQKGTLRNNSERLLEQLATRTEEDSRPIIFICHSLGGIIAKQAFILAGDFAPDLKSRLKGMVFLGTPHTGSASADLGSVLVNVVNVASRLGSLGLARSPLQAGILTDLKQNSTTLRELHETFVKQASRPTPLLISSFFETKDTVIKGMSLGIIVDQWSSKTNLAQEKPYATERDHVTICRFSKGCGGDGLWEDLARHVRDMANELDAATNKRAIQIEALRNSLKFEEQDAREAILEHDAELVHEHSYIWVLGDAPYHLRRARHSDAEDAQFRTRFPDWLFSNSPLFWIYGKAGSGKSTLMRKIYHDHQLEKLLEQWARKEHITRARMFFSSEGSELQRSREGLLRSLLFQALHENPSLAASVLEHRLMQLLPHAQVDSTTLRSASWSWSELHIAFQALLGQAKSTQRFCLFIDGLDEFSIVPTASSHPAELYLDDEGSEIGLKIREGYRWLAGMLQSLPTNGFVKVCVSSRPYNEFQTAISKCFGFRLETRTRHDIETFVRVQLAEATHTSGTTESNSYHRYARAIIQKADGVFIWVRIATTRLVDHITNGLDESRILEEIDKLPSELSGPRGLYMGILQKSHVELQTQAWRLYDVMRHSAGQLHPFTLSLAVDADAESAIALNVNTLNDTEVENRLSIITKKLKAMGGFLEVTVWRPDREGTNKTMPQWEQYVVRYMHLTVREFLLRSDVRQIAKAPTQMMVSDVQVVLLACYLQQIKYLGLSQRAAHFRFGASNMQLWKNVEKSLRYAALVEQSTGLPETRLIDHLNETMQHLWQSSPLSDNPLLAGPYGKFAFFSHGYIERATASEWPRWVIKQLLGDQTHNRLWCWNNDFFSLVVQANLTLYVSVKLGDGLSIRSKQGRPILSYAVLPIFAFHRKRSGHKLVEGPDSLRFGDTLSDTAMTKLLLEHGADPNAIYEFEAGQLPGYMTNPQTHRSIWEWLLAAGWSYTGDGAGPFISNAHVKQDRSSEFQWLETAKLMVAHGAAPNATITACYAPEESRSPITTSASALYVCMFLCLSIFDCEITLPSLLVCKGAQLQAGELDYLQKNLAEPWDRHRKPSDGERRKYQKARDCLRNFFASASCV